MTVWPEVGLRRQPRYCHRLQGCQQRAYDCSYATALHGSMSCGELSPCPAQRRYTENDRIQLLEVPQLGEIKADRRRLRQSSCFNTFDQPGQAALDSRFRCWASVEQHFHSQGGFLNAGGCVRCAAPAAIGILGGQQPGDAAPCRFAGHLVEIAVGGQYAGCTVNGILLIRSVLIAEPEGQPGAVWALAASEVFESRVDGSESLGNPGWTFRHFSEDRIGAITHIPEAFQPASNGSQSVCRQITSTTIKRQTPPTTAESWPAAVLILQVD